MLLVVYHPHLCHHMAMSSRKLQAEHSKLNNGTKDFRGPRYSAKRQRQSLLLCIHKGRPSRLADLSSANTLSSAAHQFLMNWKLLCTWAERHWNNQQAWQICCGLFSFFPSALHYRKQWMCTNKWSWAENRCFPHNQFTNNETAPMHAVSTPPCYFLWSTMGERQWRKD